MVATEAELIDDAPPLVPMVLVAAGRKLIAPDPPAPTTTAMLVSVRGSTVFESTPPPPPPPPTCAPPPPPPPTIKYSTDVSKSKVTLPLKTRLFAKVLTARPNTSEVPFAAVTEPEPTLPLLYMPNLPALKVVPPEKVLVLVSDVVPLP
ncbi:hypothetical protein MCEGEM3_01978 [Oxalobacteraceae bacterium]